MGRILRYLSDKDFKLLMRVARYAGRGEFVLDPARVRRACRELYGDEVFEFADKCEFYQYCLLKILNYFGSAISYEPSEVDAVIDELCHGCQPLLVNIIKDNGGKRPRIWLSVLARRDNYIPNDSIDYNVEVYRNGRQEYRPVRLPLAFYHRPTRSIVFAPAVYREIEHTSRDNGYCLQPNGFTTPTTAKVVTVTKSLVSKLRPYQREALEAWQKNGYRGTIQLPTGAGKTWIALAAIEQLRVPTLIIVPTDVLANQWRKNIIEKLGVPANEVGLLNANHKDLGRPVLIATYASAVSYAWRLGQQYALVIYDEGHHVSAESYKEIAWHSLAPYAMVLSATVDRPDQNERLIYRLSGRLVYRKRYHELVKAGYLPPVEVELRLVPLDGKQAQEYRRMLAELREVLPDARWGDREANRRARSLQTRLRNLEARNKNKDTIAVEEAAKAIGEGRLVMVFTAFTEQANRIYRQLAKKHPGKVALLTGKTGEEERVSIFNKFRRGELRAIVTTTVLDEGVDAPAADTAIIVSSRALRHPRQYVQRIGRIVRPEPGKSPRVIILVTRGGREEAALPELAQALREEYGHGAVRLTRARP